jgi:hypothetical protein
MADVRAAPGVANEIAKGNVPVRVDVAFLVEFDEERSERGDCEL